MTTPFRPSGTLGHDVAPVKRVRLYCTGTGSSGVPLVIDLADTTHLIGNSYKSWATGGTPELGGPVSQEAWTAAGFVLCAVKGDVTVACESGVAAGDNLVLSPSTNARVIEIDNGAVVVGNTAGNIQTALKFSVIGKALTAESSNTCTVRLIDALGNAVD